MAILTRLLSAFGGRKRQQPPREAAPQLLAQADELRRAGRIPEAIQTLQLGIAASPANVGLHVALGRALTQAGRYDDSIASLDQALLLDPENLVAIRQIADAWLKKGEKVEAIKKLKLYRGLKPGDKWVGELIDKLSAELRPTQPTELPREATTGSAAPPRPEQPAAGRAAESAPDTAPIVPPAEAAASAPAASPEPTPIAQAQGQPYVPAGEPSVASPAVTETLADLYRDQGYVADARAAYTSLASATPDAARRQELEEKAAAASEVPLATREARLRAFLSRVPATKGSREMTSLLQDLVARTEGVLSAALTDLEGLPVFSVGETEGADLESLIAELTAFWKGVGRIDGEVGTGPLRALTLSAANGGAVVSSVSDDYALILRVAPGAPMGRIRYEAARAAWLLAPALG